MKTTFAAMSLLLAALPAFAQKVLLAANGSTPTNSVGLYELGSDGAVLKSSTGSPGWACAGHHPRTHAGRAAGGRDVGAGRVAAQAASCWRMAAMTAR